MTYTELSNRIEQAQIDLDNATSQEEIDYFGMELMILEDKMDRTIAKGRR